MPAPHSQPPATFSSQGLSGWFSQTQRTFRHVGQISVIDASLSADGGRAIGFRSARGLNCDRHGVAHRTATMTAARKITLSEAAESGAVGLVIYCSAGRAQYGGCSHSARIELWLALRRWRGDRRLDELPLQCSRCGADAPDVRPDFITDNSGGSQQQEYLNSWRSAHRL